MRRRLEQQHESGGDDRDEGECGRGQQTIGSMTLAIENNKGLDYYLTQWVILSGKDRVSESVLDMVAAIDKQVQQVLADWAKAK